MPISFANEKYNRQKEELERQTLELLQEREQIIDSVQHGYGQIENTPIASFKQKRSQVRPVTPSQSIVERGLPPLNSRGKVSPRQLIGKVQEIVALCKEENTLTAGELQQVLAHEHQILRLLEEHDRKQTSQEEILNSNSQIRSLQRVRSNPRLQAPVQPYNRFLSDDVISMIEAIETKALVEIENLRDDKIQLMERLNQEINNFNELKRSAHQSIPQRTGVDRQTRQVQQELGAQLRAYQQELNTQNHVIRELQSKIRELSNIHTHPQMEILLQEGEQIRQQTINLLRLKEQYGAKNSDYRVRALEDRLAQQQNEKKAFFQDLTHFKDKYRRLEKELEGLRKATHNSSHSYNNHSHVHKNQSVIHKKESVVQKNEPTDYKNGFIRTPQSPKMVASKQGRPSHKEHLNDYEATISEMRRVVNY